MWLSNRVHTINLISGTKMSGLTEKKITHSKCLQRLDEAIRNPGTGVTDDCGLELISEMQFLLVDI